MTYADALAIVASSDVLDDVTCAAIELVIDGMWGELVDRGYDEDDFLMDENRVIDWVACGGTAEVACVEALVDAYLAFWKPRRRTALA